MPCPLTGSTLFLSVAAVPHPSSRLPLLLPAVLAPTLTLLLAVLLVVVVTWLLWYVKLRKKRKRLELIAVGEAFQLTHSSWKPQRTPHHKEFPAEKLLMRRQLGEGAFGVVYEAEAEGILGDDGQVVVAVKQLRSGGEDGVKEEFFREVAFMSRLEHAHVVRLLGVCSLTEPYSMIFEFMDLGDLCSFLREAVVLGEETHSMLTMAEQLSICLQVAEGAKYIASQHLVHRDLASRNCLVATGLVVKIADFGMSRNLYSVDYYR